MYDRQQRLRERQKKRLMTNSKKRNYRLQKKVTANLTKTLLSPSRLECSLEGSTIVTPDEYRKKIRQRVFKCNSKLPKHGRYKCFVLGRMVKRVINSPSTGDTMKKVLDKHHSSSHDRDASHLQGILRRIIRYKTKKDNVRLNRAVAELKRKSSLRGAAKKLNMYYSTLQRLISIRGGSERSVSEGDKRKVFEFYSSTPVSLQLPFKKYSRYYYLRSSLAVAYHQYVVAQRKSGDRVLSKTAVYRCLKGKFRTRKKIPFKDCQCHTCLNNSLLVDALVVAGVKGISRSNTQNVLRSYCPLEQSQSSNGTSRKLDWEQEGNQSTVLTDHNRDCIFRNCQKCGAVKFQEDIIRSNSNIDWQKIVTWHQWEKVKVDENKKETKDGKKDEKKETEVETNDQGEERVKGKKKERKQFDKICYSGTLSHLLTCFTVSIHELSEHIFNFRWQAFQFDECKKLLKDGDVLMIMDFAQNFSHHRQDEIQSALWSRQQTTLHPVVTYYPCLEESCNDLVKEEIMILSSDLKHDGFAVNKFIEKATDHLQSHNVPVSRIIMFSDNCGAQYKSCKVFDTLSKREIPVLRNYFGASHGKGEADGAIGRLSMTIDSVVRSGTFEIGNCKDLIDYCCRHLTVGDHDRGMCCHYHRYYYEVSNIERNGDPDVRTVRGTRSFHSVRNTKIPGLIEVRASSCFCEPCFLNVPGECKNKRLVKPFEWVCLYKAKSEKAKFSKSITMLDNRLWSGTSSKYVPPKTHKKKSVKTRYKTVTLNASSSSDDDFATSSDECDSYESDSDESDIESDRSFDSDYEANIPLMKLHRILKAKKSPISSRTRMRLNRKPWVRCSHKAPKLDLDDYEIERPIVPSDRTSKSDDCDLFMLSGVHPLTPGPKKSASRSCKQIKKANGPHLNIKATEVQERKGQNIPDTDECLGESKPSHSSKKQSEILNSTPQSGQVIDLTHVAPWSPIPKIPSQSIAITRDGDNVTAKRSKKFNWKSLHNRFLSCKTFKALERIAKNEGLNVPPLPPCFVGEIRVKDDKIDRLSQMHMPAANKVPAKFKSGYIPIQISADGNCALRSFSRIVYGDENHHLEMRCRIVIDSVLNMQNYTDHEYLMRGASHMHGDNLKHIGELYTIYCGIPNVQGDTSDVSVIQSVFKQDILRIRKVREYCDNWQIHSAANVLNSKIVMLFPTKNIRANVRADMDRVFLPKSLNFAREFGLLWTALTEDPRTYDHIVPLVRRYRATCMLYRSEHVYIHKYINF